MPRERAWAAMNKSWLPMGVPLRSKRPQVAASVSTYPRLAFSSNERVPDHCRGARLSPHFRCPQYLSRRSVHTGGKCARSGMLGQSRSSETRPKQEREPGILDLPLPSRWGDSLAVKSHRAHHLLDTASDPWPILGLAAP